MSAKLIVIDKPKEDEHKEFLEEILSEIKALRAEVKKVVNKTSPKPAPADNEPS